MNSMKPRIESAHILHIGRKLTLAGTLLHPVLSLSFSIIQFYSGKFIKRQTFRAPGQQPATLSCYIPKQLSEKKLQPSIKSPKVVLNNLTTTTTNNF